MKTITKNTESLIELDTFENQCPSERSSDDLASLIERGLLTEGTYVELSNGEIHHQDNVFTCNRCDENYVAGSGEREVRMGRRTSQVWCESCRDNHSFYCERSEQYFDSDYFSSVRTCDDETVCYEEYEDELYHWDSDGCYHWEPEPEEDEDDPRASYHGRARCWTTYGDTRTPFRALFDGEYAPLIVMPPIVRRCNNGKLTHDTQLGVELEIEAGDREDLCSICEKANGLSILAEQDGSLDDILGVELVGPPLPLQSYRHGVWKNMIEYAQGKATGWDAGRDYGMHVSVNRLGIDLFTQGKFICWFKLNQKLGEIVAGRKEVHWAKYVHKKVGDAKVEEGDKYEAAALRSSKRIEVRIFRSTLKWESFLKNVQFVQAVLDFACSTGVKQLGNDAEFIKMVHNSNRYRELSAFFKTKNITQVNKKLNEQLSAAQIERAIVEEPVF